MVEQLLFFEFSKMIRKAVHCRKKSWVLFKECSSEVAFFLVRWRTWYGAKKRKIWFFNVKIRKIFTF